MNEFMNIVMVGHVDHGKSTVLGRMLADANALPEGKLEQVKQTCERNSKPFEYAFLIDALKDEQSQGITIDSARVFFKTNKRHYILIDAPGHIEFLKNMVTGAARAEAAFLVIDANEGIQENSRRHGYLLSMLGIRQIAVLVNKMDLVQYDKKVFENIVKKYRAFLKDIGVEAVNFIPVSGREGDMVVEHSREMSWYSGQTVLEALDGFQKQPPLENQNFAMPVQDIYKFTNFGDARRIVAGTVVSGSVGIGDEVVFYPSGKKSRVKSFERFHAPLTEKAGAGEAIGFTLEEEIYIKRGQLAVRSDQSAPQVARKIRANIFWLGRTPLTTGKAYLLKIGTARVSVCIEKIEKVMDASTLKAEHSRDMVDRNEVAECILFCEQAIAFHLAENASELSRFVLIDDYNICGGGIICKGLKDRQDWVREKVILRNFQWIKSRIGQDKRAQRYGQKPVLVMVTGNKESPRKEIAGALEDILFDKGRFVYFLAMGNVVHGVDADLKTTHKNKQDHEEHFRRLSEIANIFLDAGAILLMSVSEMTQEDLEVVKTVIDPELLKVVWVGDSVTTDISCDLIMNSGPVETAASQIENLLRQADLFM